MKVLNKSFLYAGIILVFGALIFYLLHAGQTLNPPHPMQLKPAGDSGFSGELFRTGLREALPRLLLQIIVIIGATQLFGALFRKMGQTAVIGETVAGILLGPSLFGLLFPGTFQFIFPVESLGNLRLLSQLGLILFMFIVGMELDTRLLRKQAFEALVISHSSIIIPFALGILLSLYLYPLYAAAQGSFYAFALFMGIAMSITAFPVLARIIRERKMSDTKLGTLAISCAASDDVTAWCLLAVLIAFIRSGSAASGIITVMLVVLYAVIMLLPVRLLLKRLYYWHESGKIGYPAMMAVLFVVLLSSAYCTEIIGIHALFGAFLAGIIIPKNEVLRTQLIERISDVSLVMLLPIFFVYTGLRTNAGLLNSSALWISFLLILLCAVAGKLGGSALVARALGQRWTDSWSIGALMNTRGLMELIVLNIGYDMGILSTEIFSMMVLMALLTTMMTSPLLNRIGQYEIKLHKNS